MNNHVMGYPLKQYACQVSAIAPLSENTYQVDLLAPDDASLSYHAGQHLQLELNPEQEAGMQSLSYTIANACKPDSPQRLQLIIRKNTEFSGKIIKTLTSLHHSKKNARVTLPLCKAYLQTRRDRLHVLVAGWSGIAKMKCIMESIGMREPGADVTIYWCNRSLTDVNLLDFFQGLKSLYKTIRFIPVLESKSPGWVGQSGNLY